jgi:hypothetical protein
MVGKRVSVGKIAPSPHFFAKKRIIFTSTTLRSERGMRLTRTFPTKCALLSLVMIYVKMIALSSVLPNIYLISHRRYRFEMLYLDYLSRATLLHKCG